MPTESDDRDPLDPLIEVLRSPVPVRPSWRAGLLEHTASVGRPPRGPRLSLHPAAAAAASVVLLITGSILGASLVTRSSAEAGRIARSQSDVAESPSLASGETATSLRTATGHRPVRFALDAPGARHVTLVGDFNGWNASSTPLARDAAGNDRWTITLELAPGRHVYAFVVDGDLRADPGAPRAPEDDFGTPNSVVLVSSARGETGGSRK